MKTKLIKITDIEKEGYLLDEAVEYIKNDEIVAIPTETVYGLGANGLSESACKKIFQVKGRPQDNPIILHISKMEDMDKLVKNIPYEALIMLENLWPGPLTVILEKKNIVPSIVTGGGNTVAIRMPSNQIARKIIEKAEVPIAAPSANLSGRPSPTTANDVLEDLDGKIPLIIDGGQSSIGIESTVLDLTEKPYTILRPGFYDKEDLENYLEEVVYDNSILENNISPKSPGQKYRHYAPKATLEIVIGSKDKIRDYICQYEKNTDYKKTAYILFEEDKNILQKNRIFLTLGSKKKLNEMAFNLFKNLRIADNLGVDHIICEGIEEKGIGIGIMNRLKKSSSNNIIYL